MQRQNAKPQPAKTKIEPRMESVIQVKLPMVRNFSTGGGHGPETELVEGDAKIVTKKWQGYPPQNLNVVGKPLPPMAEVAIPRFLGKAEYATRVHLPDMLFAKFLASPHPRSRIKSIDTSRAEKMPGVAAILTYKNSPSTYPLPRDLNYQGEVVALVAAETEDLAEDAVWEIDVEYDVLPAVGNLSQAMAADAPDLRSGKGNLILLPPTDPHYDPKATWVAKHGDVDKGFAEADIIKEFTYYFAGATAVPIQPCGGVAKWDGDKLTFWGMGQGIYPLRNNLARSLGIEPEKIHYINKWNGCTLGGVLQTFKLHPWLATLAKLAGRPVKLMLPKDQEIAHINAKPENITKFKVGAKKDGRITAVVHEVYLSNGDLEGGSTATSLNSKNQTELYTTGVPNWRSAWYGYKTNTIRTGPVRSATQQEVKWGWENMIDEMAEALNMDPIAFRMMHIAKPGTKLTKDWDAYLGETPEIENGAITYDSFASVEVLQEGAKAIGWERRNSKPGSMPGRFKRGIGLAMSQHHPGHMGYHDGELIFEKMTQGRAGQGDTFGAEIELGADGNVTMKNALPDSGTNHDTALAALVSEILGFTTRNHVRVVWGDSDLAPASGQWAAGMTITIQGAAVCSAADKLRKDLLKRASDRLGVEAAKLQIKDGVISVSGEPAKKTTFAALVAANGGPLRQQGRGAQRSQGRSNTKGVGGCFMEVEVDTWTGDWHFVRTVYVHDVGLVVNPLVAEADMHGSLIESAQMTTDPIPYDREFPGTRHYSVGFLSYRIPTIMDVPEQQTQVFIDSLEPRWFFGIKSFSETSIGSVPGAISNAIYNACGVRVREHPITREKIIAGLKAKKA